MSTGRFTSEKGRLGHDRDKTPRLNLGSTFVHVFASKSSLALSIVRFKRWL